MPELCGMRAVVQFLRQSAEPCVAPPTSPFMALLMEPRAVKAHARFPRCSSVCGCVFPVVLRSGPGVLLTQDQANQDTDLSRFPDALRPTLFVLGQHNALVAVDRLLPNGRRSSRSHAQLFFDTLTWRTLPGALPHPSSPFLVVRFPIESRVVRRPAEACAGCFL